MGAESDHPRAERTTNSSNVVRKSDVSLAGLLLLLALVAVGATFAVRLFEAVVERLFQFGFSDLPEWFGRFGWPAWSVFLLFPFLLGLAAAGIKHLVAKPDRHHSIPLVIVSMVKRRGKIHPLATLWKTLSAILTLGAGGSLGREGPVVLLGGTIGSALGSVFGLREDRINTLIAAGACAAIATAFHAPITGVFFAMEIVLAKISSRSFALLALASVTATQLSQLLVGNPPFPIPSYQLTHGGEILLYLGLGLAIAPLARLYIKVIYGSEEVGKRIRWIPDWLKPALGGVMFGAVALVLPRTLGGGYQTITEALAGKLGLGLLVLLLVAKLFTIALTSGSGWSGGVFTPALFLGSMAGGAYGIVAGYLLPGWVAQPGAYAVVGMAAMIAAATQAPLTAMTLIFEVTRDYRIALPAMLACGVASVFSQRFSMRSIDTLHLSEHGVLLPWEFHDLRNIRVEDVMERDVHAVLASMQVRELIEVMQRHRHGGFPVLDEADRLVGMVTLRDVREIPIAQRLSKSVSAVMARDLVVVTPDQPVAEAARLIARHRLGRVPVVDPADTHRLVGILSRSDILRAYPNEESGEAIEGATFLER